MKPRPVAVTAIGVLFVCVGIGSLIRGPWTFFLRPATPNAAAPGAHDLIDLALVILSGVLAALGGVYVLRGRNWARWLVVAWMGAHVVLSLFHDRVELAVHALVFVAIVAALFGGARSAYFAAAPA